MFDRRILAIPGARRLLVKLGALAVCRAVLTVVFAAALAHVLAALWAGAAAGALAQGIAAAVLCLPGRYLVGCAADAVLDRWAPAYAARLRRELLARLLRDGSLDAAGLGNAEGVELALEGIDRVETYLRLTCAKLSVLATVPVLTGAALIAADAVSGVIALVAFPFIILFMVLIGSTAGAEAVRRQRDQAQLSNHFIDAVRGLDTLRAFGRARAHAQVIFQASERLRASTLATLRIATLSSAVLDLFATGAVAAIAILLGFRLIEGSITLAPALFVLILAPEFFRPVREFAADYHATLDGARAAERIAEVLARPERVPASLPAGTWGAASRVQLAGVSFTYPGAAAPALRDVACELAGCGLVGIVGASGAGKSTLLNLLGGFLDPSRGSVAVRWDGQAPASRPLSTLHAPAWQRQMLFIPQHPHLFAATLAENIAFYAPQASRAAVAQAAEAAGLARLIAELPQGLDTRVGEGARELSGGEAHRVALARALVDPARRILLLDEPTAHLDVETELELKGRLLPLVRGRLVVMATHRLHWLKVMDRVLVLEDGRVVEQGVPAELLARGGTLARLVAAEDAAAAERGGAHAL